MKDPIAKRNKQRVLNAFDRLFNRRDDDAASSMWSENYGDTAAWSRPSSARRMSS